MHRNYTLQNKNYLALGGSSFMTKYTGQTLYDEERKRETPSVFIWSDRWISFSLAALLVPWKNPSGPKCFL